MRLLTALLTVILAASPAAAAPRERDSRVHPRDIPALPSYVQRIAPSLIGLAVTVPPGARTAARLGTQRTGTAIVVDPRGYAVTVNYLLLDAEVIEARTRDGRTLAARLVGVDFESGLGLVRLDGPGPWRAAAVGDSRALTVGGRTGTVGLDEDGDLVWVGGELQGTRRFAGAWEYMLDRALIVSPASRTWSGNAVVDARGDLVGVASLRLGEHPYVNLAIPIEKLLAVKDELIAAGRVTSRPARPWLGLLTLGVPGGVVVSDVSPAGPAAGAGFQRGDRIERVDGVIVRTQEEFYERLWSRRAGDVIEVAVRRDDALHVIEVRSIDRHGLFRTREP